MTTPDDDPLAPTDITAHSQGSAGTLQKSLLQEMLIDIYASPDTPEVMIAYNQPLRAAVKELVLDLPQSRLLFVYEDGQTQEYGEPIKRKIMEYLMAAPIIDLFQIDMQTKAPVAGSRVPLTVQE